MPRTLPTLALSVLLTAPAAGQSAERVKLLPGDPGNRDWFAEGVDVHGALALVGAAQNDDLGFDAGCAYLFDAETGEQLAKLLAADGSPGDRFGTSVALNETYALVSAPGEDNVNGGGAGAVYVFDVATRTQLRKLIASDGGQSHFFGADVAIDGSTALIGTSGQGDSAYLFDLATGTELAKLTAPTPPAVFGFPVDLQGDRAVVGDLFSSAGGAAYLFDTQTFAYVATLVPADLDSGDRYGWATLCGSTVAVGAPGDDDDGSGSGSVYLFDAATGDPVGKLRASDASAGAAFGYRVAGSGSTLVVAATPATAPAGVQYLVDLTRRAEFARLRTSDVDQADAFPEALAIDGARVLVGARRVDDLELGLIWSGAAYVFSATSGLAFCDGTDGALAACPCANPGTGETGCDVRQGTGGVALELVGQDVVPANRATWSGSGFPTASAPATILLRASAQAGPQAFGDGVSCLGAPLVRIGAAFAIGGASTNAHGHHPAAGAGTFYYQLWFRNGPAAFCVPGEASNLSNGRSLSW